MQAASGGTSDESWRRRNVGRSIFNAFEAFERDLLAKLAKEGFGDVRRVQLSLYRNLELTGTRLTDLAQRAAMTKQGMQELVDRAVKAGYVERMVDPTDRRAKVIAFTCRGLSLLEGLHRAIAFAQAQMAAAVGEDNMQAIAAQLDAYVGQSASGPVADDLAGKTRYVRSPVEAAC